MKKNQLNGIVCASLLLAGSAFAQTAGTWMVRAGAVNLSPDVSSGCLSAPDFGDHGVGSALGCSRVDVSANTQLAVGVTYMYTDNLSVDVPVGLPFKHKLSGDGALIGTGDLAEVKAWPITVFLQYRFLEAKARFRPYLGLGVTYAYFFDEQGSGKLTAVTNPGGPPTSFTVDSKWILTPQMGATIAIDDKWFVDLSLSKSKLKTRTHYSTGQYIDKALDPTSLSVSVGYKF